jgi:cell division protein FtsA
MAGKPIYAVGLDAGSRVTRLVICVLEHGRMRFLGCAAAESRGWSKGKIVDQPAAAASILAALREAEARAGVSVESVVAGVGGLSVRGASSQRTLELGYVRELEEKDIRRLMDRCSRVQLMEDRMALHVLPQDFVVDGHPGHHDPRGMMASELDLNVHIITGSTQEHSSLVGAVNQAHLLVEDTVFEGLAACYAAVLPEERREGIAVVDIGAHTTEMVVYYGDAMHLAASIPICGDHFTRDLAQPVCMTFDEAETVKLEFGGALCEASPENVWVELPSPDGKQRETTRRYLAGILEARAVELFSFVRERLEHAGMEHALLGGVFLSGGGAKLPELCDVAERVLQCHARYGLAIGIRDWPVELNDPEWTAVAGLAMYSAKLKARAGDGRAQTSWFSRMMR